MLDKRPYLALPYYVGYLFMYGGGYLNVVTYDVVIYGVVVVGYSYVVPRCSSLARIRS